MKKVIFALNSLLMINNFDSIEILVVNCSKVYAIHEKLCAYYVEVSVLGLAHVLRSNNLILRGN